MEINDYVLTLTNQVEKSLSGRNVYHNQTEKYLKPYGAMLIWQLPHGMKMHVHLKDKRKIRIKKRWSQVRNCICLFDRLEGSDNSLLQLQLKNYYIISGYVHALFNRIWFKSFTKQSSS